MPAADAVRTKVQAVTGATKAQMAVHLHDFYKELIALGLSTEVASQQDLIPVLAANMAGAGGDVNASMAGARGQIEGNQTTALTLSDDRYVGIKGGNKFDELHELIHIMSAPGGVSPLHEWKLQANEGAINVFSGLTAPLAGVDVVARYTDETRIIGNMLKLITSAKKENEGWQALYGMTFGGAQADGHRTTFFRLVGAAFVDFPVADHTDPKTKTVTKDAKVRPGGALKVGSEKTWTANAAGDEFEAKVKNWNVMWLDQRLPA